MTRATRFDTSDRMRIQAARCLLLVVALAACLQGDHPPRVAARSSVPRATSSLPSISRFDAARVAEVVRALAGIGPRETTSVAFRRAGAYVDRRFRALGLVASRQTFRVPAGLSNFAEVQEGETFNVIATTPGFDPARPHLVVGAHLDTVPQAPGAVDNAAGVGIVLELARLASIDPPPTPIIFVAFGGEEARVPHGGLHGSRAYVASLSAPARDSIVGAVVIDRLGTASRVPVCVASASSRAFGRRFADAARRLRVPAYQCTNGSSDHASFQNAEIMAVRIGPDNYPEYHTPRDTPGVFVAAQAQRAGDLLWEALHSYV